MIPQISVAAPGYYAEAGPKRQQCECPASSQAGGRFAVEIAGQRAKSAPIPSPAAGAPMTDLSAFPIGRRGPAAHPDRRQLYALNTPNGVKVSIMLEETGPRLRSAHLVDIGKDRAGTSEFLSLNPNGKIPAILDPMAGRGAAGPVRVRRDPESIWPTRPTVPRPRRAALSDDPVADVADGRIGSDVRPGRLLPQIRRPRL